MTLTEFLVLWIALASIAGAAALVILARRINRTAEEAERLARNLGPKIDRALEETRGELEEFRRLTERLNSVAGSLEKVATEAGRAAVPLLQDIERLRQTKRYLEAAAAGVRRGFETWRERTSSPDHHEEGAES